MLSSNSNNNFLFQSVFEALEDRVLFDGVPDATFVLPQADATQPVPAQVQSLQAADSEMPRELILVDAGVQNADQLLAGILDSKPDSALEVRILDANSDGVQQISDLLAASEGKYDAIHILSHGSAGEVNLGNVKLTSENATGFADQLASWSEALTEDADLLFYGCELAADQSGQELISYVSAVTGTDVAASDDLTGAAEKQGDWELEFHIGAVATQSISAQQWQGVLADTDGDGLDDADDLDDDNDGILDVTEGSFITTVTLDQVSALPPSAFISGGGVIPDGSDGLRLTDASSGYALDLYNGPNSSAGAPYTFNTTTGRIQSSGANVLGGGAGVGEVVEIVYTTRNSTLPYNLSSFQINDIDSLTSPTAPTSVRDAYAFSETGTWTTEGLPNSTAAVISVDPAAPDGVGNFVQNDPDGNNNINNVGQFDQVLAIDGTISDVLTNMSGNANDHNVVFEFDTPQEEASLYAFNSGGSNMFWGLFPQLDITVDNIEGIDTDGDGVSDHLDLDSDNDGISDLYESGTSAANIAADANADGTISIAESALASGGIGDADLDGLMDIFDANTADGTIAASVGTNPVDRDGDATEDWRDLDSDNDGIADTIEARPTAGYVANDGDVTNNDADGDGVIDIFDSNDGTTGVFGGTHANFNAPEDTDGDGTPDHLDDDSDNDGKLDTDESGLPAVSDATYTDPDGSVTTTSADLDNESGDTSEIGFRELNAELGVAKEVFAGPTAQPDGTFTLTYQVVVANTGVTDMENLSVTDDLATQFGAAFVSASNLTLIAGPTDPNSSVSVNNAYDGSLVTEMIAPTGTGSNLVEGDSFTVQFEVVINPTTSALDNQVTASGTGLDPQGNPIVDQNGDPAVFTDNSDSGADPDGDNVGEDGDTGGSDDATPLYLPSIGLAKEAGDAVANGDNFDVTFTLNWQNTGNISLDSVEILDDIAAQFGAQFVSAAIDNVVYGGAATVAANGAWAGDTAQSLITTTGPILAGETIQVEFTVTIDPDAAGTSTAGLENSATSTGTGINPNTGVADPNLPASDTSDNGTDATGDNAGNENNDGTFGNDPTPIVIADITVAKEVFGTPTLLSNGNFEVTYNLVVENTGNVDLADLSLSDDLATQFGSAFVNAGALTMDTPPSNSSSNVTLDAADWNGSTTTEMIDQSATNLLKVGDMFVVQITVEVDPDASGAPGALNNTATAEGDAVGENGDPITDSNGNPIVSSDDSDSGSDPNGTNPGEEGDTGGSDDPTPLYIPAVGLAKQAGDAVANGDNFDVTFTLTFENTGTVDLNNLTMFDDVAAQFGNAYVSASGLSVQNFVGTGTAPTANGAWTGNTSLNLLTGGLADIGDSFEVVFTVTIDPDGVDSLSQGLQNTAVGGGDALDSNGDPLTDDAGNPITVTDTSDNGVDANGENGEDNMDGTFANDPTPIVIADLSVAKQVVGSPAALANGNFEVVYQLIIENNGTVDIASLSLLEDLGTQFGAAYIDAYNLTMVTPPADANSNVALDSANWDGDTSTEMVNQVVPSLLAVGDSFVVQFTVEVDPDAGGTSAPLNNTVTASGSAVDPDGNPYTDADGNPITATDDSDSGTDPSDANPGEPGDTGGSDDPTPLYIPAIGLAKQAGDAVANGDNFDVTFTFVYENTGTTALSNLTLMDDIAAQFGNAYVSASGLSVQNFVGTGTAPTANAAWTGDTSLNMISGGTADTGDSFEVVFTVTIDPDGIDGLSQGLENSGTAGGDAIDDDGNPITDGAGNPVTATDTSDNGTDPNGENGADEDGDGGVANDPTPIIIADISVAKEVVGTPTLLPNDNFSVTYQLVVENTGTVDLADFSLADDLATQFGASYIDAGSLTLIGGPSSPGSSIVLDSSNWDGDAVTEMLNQSINNTLVIGDTIIVQFTVEVDPDASGTSGPLNNSAVAEGDAVDDNGDPITDSNGDPVTTTDDSDSGSDPSGTNPGEPGDTGGSDDPTPLQIPAVAVAKQANTVVVATDGAGNELTGSFDVQYLLVIENTGTVELTNLQMVDDLTQLAMFGDAYDASLLTGPTDRSGLVAGPSFVSNTMANPGDLPTLNGGFLGGPGTDGIFDGASGTLQTGEQIVVSITVRIDSLEFTDGDAGDANGVAPGNQVSGSADSAVGSATDDSDDGLNPNTDNGDGGTDDPTPFEVPQVRLYKSQSDAISNGDGTSTITVTLRVANTGTVNLSNLSLTEDLANQFGAAFISTTAPVIDASAAPGSNVPAGLINSAWQGDTSQDVFDPAVTTETLIAGDSFTVSFDVTVDPDLLDDDSDYLTNTATITGDGQNFDGTTISVDDESGADNGTGIDSDEPTPAIIPEIAVVKAAGDAVANGENFDVPFTLVVENTGSVNLDSLTLLDDVAAQFGDAYVSISGVAIQNFAGAGTAPAINSGWASDTTQNILVGGDLNPGDRFEVTFIVTIDPDGVDNEADPLANQATAGGRAVDQMGNPLTDAGGNPLLANDDSDSGTNPQGTNPGEDGDTGVADDPTPIIIADAGVAKSVVGTPAQLANGNFEVTYQLVFENTGTTNLSDLTLVDDLATQFGAAFVDINGINLATPPTGASSSVTVDADWDGTSATDMIDQSVTTNLLEIGDSFVVEFVVEIDAAAATGNLDNTATAGGTAVDADGNPYTDDNGDPIEATDDSDSGTDPNGDNPGQPGDDGTGATDNPTPLYIPSIGLAKSAGDAVANGENFDVTFTLVFENTGTVDLTNLTMFDDIAAQFGAQYVGISGLAVQNFSGSGTAPTANAAWTSDTTASLITGGTANVDDTFEVVFTVTIDPDATGVAGGLSNTATAGGEALDENGDPITDGAGDPVTANDDSDNGTDPTGENGEDDGDGTFANDPTPIVIADLAIAKAVAGSPVSLGDGNFAVTYQVVVENTGTVDLANLSLIEDLATQYGAVYVDAGSLTLVTPPVNAASNVTLDSANWDGGSVTELVDSSVASLLAAGDSFAIEFTVTVDPSQTVTPVTNSIVGGGDAVDEDGNPLTDDNGDPIEASDTSDSGSDPNDTNSGAPGDTGGTDDPTPLYVPSVGLAKQAGDAVANGDDWDITFTFAFENNGTTDLINLTLYDDIAAQFGNAFVSASGLMVQNFVGTGTAPLANAAWTGDTSQSLISGGTAAIGDTFEVVFTVTIDPDGIDNAAQPLENSGTGGGEALDENGDPLTDDDGDPIVATDDSDNGTDPDGDNGEETTPDGTFGNDPTPIVIADLGIAKEVVGSMALANGNFEVIYQVTVENTGTVDLANLNLTEDLATQFGAAFVNAGSLTLTTPPAAAGSTVAVDATFNGGSSTGMISGSAPSLLVVGDSFIVQFTVEVDLDAGGNSGPLNNTVVGGGDAVDENGDPITDGAGDPVTASDDSDSGNDPNGDNPDDQGDEGTRDDPTPLLIPDVGVAKAAGDAVANGENFDVTFTLLLENTGTVSLSDLSLADDVMSQFGNAFVSSSGLMISNFVGTGTAPTANAAWIGDSSQNLLIGGSLDVGDYVEVTFTVTIDPDGIDGTAQPLNNSAVGSGSGVNPDGSPLVDDNGDPVTGTDTSDDGTDPNDPGDDPSPIVIADLGIAKQVVGTPIAVGENFEVTYRVVVENTGTVDLANLSLLEDLSGQYGSALVSAGSLVVVSPPVDPGSTFGVNGSFDGSGDPELAAADSSLAVGDSVTIEFKVVVDLSATGAANPLTNQIVGSGDAVDENGDPILDSNGDPVSGTDDSDAGSDPSNDNPGDQGDNGTAADPTPLLIPDVGVAKIAGDAVANGENFDVTFTLVYQNTGTVSLNSLSLVDDIEAQFGNAFVAASGLTVGNFAGTGTAPMANLAWSGNTAANMLIGGTVDPGDRFEVTFVVTIDPDADGSTGGMSNQATGSGTGLNPDGTQLTDSNGNPYTASDISDSGTDATGDNGEGNTSDPTTIVIADLGIAKSVAGEPTLLFNGNSVVTFEVVVENTGTVDLASLSLLEDLATQFGDAFVSTSNLTLTTGPSNPLSNIALDTAGFDGATSAELLDQTSSNVLAVGDSFTIQFTVEVDPDGATGPLSNQVAGSGDAVDANGDPLLDANGDPVSGNDVSDSGSDPGNSNPGGPGDTGTADDPTLFTPAERGSSSISGSVYIDRNSNGVRDAGETGIEGVEVTLLGTDAFGNAVELTTLTDANGNYSFEGLNAGTYQVIEAQPDGFNDGLDSSSVAGSIGNDQLDDIILGFGQNFENNNFGELLSGTSGNPSRLPPLIPFNGERLSNRISSFLGGPGPIYSGIPIASNGNPLTLDSGRPVTGGYASEFATADTAVDCGCPEVVEVVDACDPCNTMVAEPEVVVETPCDQAVIDEQFVETCECQACEEFVACDQCSDCGNCCDCGSGPVGGGFLFRFRNWLGR